MTNNPKTWGEMTPEEKGALLLARHEGKVIECWQWDDGPWLAGEWCFDDASAYRVKPKRETVTMTGGTHHSRGFLCFGADAREEWDTHRITFDTIDGEPVCASIRMEVLK